ncbi:hypothetical protein ZEAMMB73_Zm00001d022470, partial [Zea mays]
MELKDMSAPLEKFFCNYDLFPQSGTIVLIVKIGALIEVVTLLYGSRQDGKGDFEMLKKKVIECGALFHPAS